MRVTEIEAELAIDVRARLGEGPLWDDRAGALRWVDIHGRRVHAHRPEDGWHEVVDLPQEVGAIALRDAGGLVLALEDGIWLLDDGAREPRRFAPIEAHDRGTRANDGRVDALGRFWIGTMGHDAEPGRGALYRVDPGGRVATQLADVTISNGLDWSPDGDVLYYVDTPTQRVDRLCHDPSSGALSDRRPFVTIDPADGSPDGLTVDAEGGVWVALWGGGAVRRYSPAASLELVVRVPVPQVTSCAFGGDGLDELWITTAWDGLSEKERARAPHGAVFLCRPGVAGRRQHRFGG